ncbi:hypothetical protein G9A89_018646 [Geosiphon pyriformis]|nr:hypothetical protein G9A89_018646 [Geosiphon pyriformis]
MAAKVKNSKKQQQAVTTAMVTLNPFVVPDEILGKISIAAASSLPDMDGNSSSTSPKMVAKLSINSDDLKDWADQMEMESTVPPPVSGAIDSDQNGPAWFLVSECLNGATKVAISDEVFLTTLKIAWFSGVVSVFSLSLSVALCDVPLGTSSDDIKTALGIFGVVTSVKLKPTGLWQYAVVNFKDISSAAAALSNWSVLVRKDSIRLFLIANQKEKLPPLPPKLPFNTFGSPNNFKPSFVESKFYAKAAAFVVSPGAAAADMDFDLGGPSKTVTSMLSAVFSAPNSAVESRLASLESHLSELSVLIKSLVEPVDALVALVTKLLSILSVMDVSVKKCVNGLAKQNKGLAAVATMM